MRKVAFTACRRSSASRSVIQRALRNVRGRGANILEISAQQVHQLELLIPQKQPLFIPKLNGVIPPSTDIHYVVVPNVTTFGEAVILKNKYRFELWDVRLDESEYKNIGAWLDLSITPDNFNKKNWISALKQRRRFQYRVEHMSVELYLALIRGDTNFQELPFEKLNPRFENSLLS